MSTTYSTTWVERTSASTQYVSSLLWKYWDAIRKRRDRQKLRSALSDLSDRELYDVGISRGEVDYVVSNRTSNREVLFGLALNDQLIADKGTGPVNWLTISNRPVG